MSWYTFESPPAMFASILTGCLRLGDAARESHAQTNICQAGVKFLWTGMGHWGEFTSELRLKFLLE